MKNKGFTLIELLIALVLMSILALFSWRSLDGMTKTQQYTQQFTDQLITLQTGLAQWQADLDGMRETGIITPVYFNGQFVRIIRRDALEPSKLRVVAWARLAGSNGKTAWYRWQSSAVNDIPAMLNAAQEIPMWVAQNGAGKSTENSSVLRLIEDTEDLQLYFYRTADNTWYNPQSSEEPSNQQKAPDAVRLELVLGKSEAIKGKLNLQWIRSNTSVAR